MDWFQGPDHHSKVRYFDWLINLDGVGVDIRGGVYSTARDGWHVFSEEVALYVSGGRPGATETASHPDSPVCGGGAGDKHRLQLTQKQQQGSVRRLN